MVLAGEGRAFCAGADVAWMLAATTMTRDENEAQAATLGRLFLAIDACPAPVVARVQGPALGGGAGLLCVADVVIAEAGAVTGFPEVRLGLAAATIAPYVVRRIGEGRARALFTTGVRIDALEAQRVGLVHWVVDDTDALDAAVDEAIDGDPGRGSRGRPGGQGARSRPRAGAGRSADTLSRGDGQPPRGSAGLARGRGGAGGVPRATHGRRGRPARTRDRGSAPRSGRCSSPTGARSRGGS